MGLDTQLRRCNAASTGGRAHGLAPQSPKNMLGGLVRTLKTRARISIGWLTPILGLFVLLDLLSFWIFSWGIRDRLTVSYGLLVFGLAVSGMYYMASPLIFPDLAEDWPNLDDYYLTHRRHVPGLVWLCNLVPVTLSFWQAGLLPGTTSVVLMGLYWLFVAVAIATRNKIANGAALTGLVALYLVFAVV